MTVEEKALALVNGIAVAERKLPSYLVCDRRNDSRWEALCRAIKAHEADKKAFSDAVKVVQQFITGPGWDRGDHYQSITLSDGRKVRFADFILPDPEPDPLVEIAREMTLLDGVVRTDNQKAAIREGRAGSTASDEFYDRLRMALPACGYKIERIEQ